MRSCLKLNADGRRYVISKDGTELIIYPNLINHNAEYVINILLEIKKSDCENKVGAASTWPTSQTYEVNTFPPNDLANIGKAIADNYIKTWGEFKSIPAHANYKINTTNTTITEDMNYGEVIKLALGNSYNELPTNSERAAEKDAEAKTRESSRQTENKQHKLSTRCVQDILSKTVNKVQQKSKSITGVNLEKFWGYNFLNITVKILPNTAQYKTLLRLMRNNVSNKEFLETNFDKKNNIISLQNLVKKEFKIDKSQHGRTAYGIALIGAALANYDYCLTNGKDTKNALNIIRMLPARIKLLDPTGKRNTTIAKKDCVKSLRAMVTEIEKANKTLSDTT